MEVVKARRSATGGSASAPLGAGGRAAAPVLAGNLRQDKQDLKINELDQLFKDPEFPPVTAPGGPAAGAGAAQEGTAGATAAPGAAAAAAQQRGIPFPAIGGSSGNSRP